MFFLKNQLCSVYLKKPYQSLICLEISPTKNSIKTVNMVFKCSIFTLMSMYMFLILQLQRCADAVNSRSIKCATEHHLRRMQYQIEDNYRRLVEANEYYTLCDVYDLCNNPPTLYSDDSEQISDDYWLTSGTPWHNPQCIENETLPGVKANNHNPETGEPLTHKTCPQSYPYSSCDYDNSNVGAGIKIPFDTDVNSQEFIDATCFAHDLEEISTTRVYSNCHNNSECYAYELASMNININNMTNDEMKDMINTTQVYCQDYGICSTTQIPEVGSFAPNHVEYQYYADQRTGILLNIPAMYWDPSNLDLCPGTYDPRFRPWYVICAYDRNDLSHMHVKPLFCRVCFIFNLLTLSGLSFYC